MDNAPKSTLNKADLTTLKGHLLSGGDVTLAVAVPLPSGEMTMLLISVPAAHVKLSRYTTGVTVELLVPIAGTSH